MTQHIHTHRRADRGTLIVRASVVAVGLAASVGGIFFMLTPLGAAVAGRGLEASGPSSD